MRRPITAAGGLVLTALLISPPSAAAAPDLPEFPAKRPVTTVETHGSERSPFGKLTSARWAHGAKYERRTLDPVANPNPAPEPQPRREHPFDVAVAASGRRVYISLAGTELEPGHEVAVYDVERGQIMGRIPLAARKGQAPASSPYRLKLHPGGRFLWVTNRLSNFISVIDTTVDEVVAEIEADFYCQGVEFSADGRTAYVANRYLDQVLVIDVDAGPGGSLRVQGGLDFSKFTSGGASDGVHSVLVRRCGEAACHDTMRGGFDAGKDAARSFASVLGHVEPGASSRSRLLRAVTRADEGGYADIVPKFRSHANGAVIFADKTRDPDYRAIAAWIDAGGSGPGIPVGNPRSKPKVLALGSDGRHLYVGNTGTQDISIIDTTLGSEVGGIYVQNVINDLEVVRDEKTQRDYLLVTTEGIGFGVGRDRDPYGAETWDRSNPAAHFTVWRDLETGAVLPSDQQQVLGPFDAVDGTAAIKFRDIQNDLLFIDLSTLEIPDAPPASGLEYVLVANRYEAHAGWVRYTSDTAESTWGDVKGDIPPDLMRVVGAFPEKMAIVQDRVFVTMQASAEVQELQINPSAADPIDYLVPVRTHRAGLQPIGIAAGRAGTASGGKLFVANFLGGTLTVIDLAENTSKEVVVDRSILRRPVPDTNAERGEVFAHTAIFSSDGDTSCMHCHYLDMGDGRAWGVSQVVGQEYVHGPSKPGNLVIGGTMGVPQMRGLFDIQPFFIEGTISAFEPRSMIMEHCPADDFAGPMPGGDFTEIEAHYELDGTDDLQSSMDSSTGFRSSLEERRDEMFRVRSMQWFGKAFTLRDFQRFVGEWQIHEPRLLPNPFDRESKSIKRGKALFEDPQVGCVSCHPPPSFAKKDFEDNPQQALSPLVTFTARDGAFTLIGMNRMDTINGVPRDLEPWDVGRAEARQGQITSLQLRGIWDRPPVFLHNGTARTLREVLAIPGHPSLRQFPYEPLVGGVPERPGRKEIGFNETFIFYESAPKVALHMMSGARIGVDTHGGTSQLSAQEIDDLTNFLQAIE